MAQSAKFSLRNTYNGKITNHSSAASHHWSLKILVAKPGFKCITDLPILNKLLLKEARALFKFLEHSITGRYKYLRNINKDLSESGIPGALVRRSHENHAIC
jgi:hypothetical protein